MRYRLLSSTKALVTFANGADIVLSFRSATEARTRLEGLGAVREGLMDRIRLNLETVALTHEGLETGEVGSALVDPIPDPVVPGSVGEWQRDKLVNELFQCVNALEEYSPVAC